MKRIRVFDYLQQYQDIEDKILSGINTVLNSGNLILGEIVNLFFPIIAVGPIFIGVFGPIIYFRYHKRK